MSSKTRPAPAERQLTGGPFLRTLALVFGAIAALTAVDTFLATTERAEDRSEAGRLFREGQELKQNGRNLESVERFKSAVSIERGNRDYQLALAEALLAAGKLDDAAATLRDLLQQDSTNGAANLTMARVLDKQGKLTEAASSYHRAIYGQWRIDPVKNRVRVRFELVDLLTRENARGELLAELLPLAEEAPSDLETRKRIGQLFIAAGSPTRGADAFREVLRAHPQDADAYAGLGDAEFARENYQTALARYSVALRLAADNQSIRRKLELCNQVLALDPTGRGLTAGERYSRSVKLLEQTLAVLDGCAAASSAPSTQELRDAARKAVKQRALYRQNEASEASLDLAERLWEARKTECAASSTPDEPVGLVLAKIAQ